MKEHISFLISMVATLVQTNSKLHTPPTAQKLYIVSSVIKTKLCKNISRKGRLLNLVIVVRVSL